jgi:anaerobic selenocysteine-containing dehydrogenase
MCQLSVRAFGANNLPDCSNMCHESTSVALAESIGIGTATLSDVSNAEFIILAGQNPGINHPRMLTAPVLVRTRLAPPPRRAHPAHRLTPGAILRMGARS